MLQDLVAIKIHSECGPPSDMCPHKADQGNLYKLVDKIAESSNDLITPPMVNAFLPDDTNLALSQSHSLAETAAYLDRNMIELSTHVQLQRAHCLHCDIQNKDRRCHLQSKKLMSGCSVLI